MGAIFLGGNFLGGSFLGEILLEKLFRAGNFPGKGVVFPRAFSVEPLQISPKSGS